MSYIIKNTSGLINTRLTDVGRRNISQGNFSISYFQIGDSEVSYSAATNYNIVNNNILMPAFNAQNDTGSPQSNKQNIKYPFYVDGGDGNTYGIPFPDAKISPIYNQAATRGFFSGNTTADTINWSAYTNSDYTINSNYIVDMSKLDGGDKIKMEKISEEERSNRIFIITSLIRENEKDHVRLEKELKELEGIALISLNTLS